MGGGVGISPGLGVVAGDLTPFERGWKKIRKITPSNQKNSIEVQLCLEKVNVQKFKSWWLNQPI